MSVCPALSPPLRSRTSTIQPLFGPAVIVLIFDSDFAFAVALDLAFALAVDLAFALAVDSAFGL